MADKSKNGKPTPPSKLGGLHESNKPAKAPKEAKGKPKDKK